MNERSDLVQQSIAIAELTSRGQVEARLVFAMDRFVFVHRASCENDAVRRAAAYMVSFIIFFECLSEPVLKQTRLNLTMCNACVYCACDGEALLHHTRDSLIGYQ